MSQDRPKVEAPSMPNDTHGHKNPQKIGKDAGLDLKVSFVVLPSAPRSSQGVPGRQSQATKHAK